LGPNGAWKTTTLKCILWFLKPTSWKIKIFWKDFNDKEVYKKIGYAPENAFYYDHLTWIEFLIFMGQLAWLSKQDSEIIGMWLLEKLGLIYAANRYVKSYSKWMKQRLWLAASLINDPDLIFWDEPMSWLDPLWRVLVKDLMKHLKQQWKTIFFNTHILSDVEEVADRFGIIFDWKIIYEDYTKNLNKPLEEFFKEIIKQHSSDIEIR
jgi:ABC-2 type transport system ATP-binding protein